MAHFAHLDDTNTVTNVIVINNDVVGDTYPESEPIGQQFIADVLGFDGTWLQTSYHANFRGIYAGIGYTYDAQNDVFVEPPLPEPIPEPIKS